MDPVTHTLAGAAMARAGLDRRTPLAMATLMLAASAPDIDILSMFGGSYASLAFRRGWTHGPVALLLLPFALTTLIILWDRLVRRRRDSSLAPAVPGAILLLSAIGVVSHPVLDWLNTYGIRLLMPFSERWFHADAVFIIDPWIWLMLGLGLFLPGRTPRRVQRFGAAALVYAVAMIGMSAAAESIAGRHAESRGITGITDVMYAPVPMRPLAGGLIVVTEAAYHFGDFRWLAGGASRVQLQDAVTPRGDWNDPAVHEAMRTDDVRDYLTWSRYPFVRVEPSGAGTAVTFGDARFTGSIGGGSLGGLRVVVSAPATQP